MTIDPKHTEAVPSSELVRRSGDGAPTTVTAEPRTLTRLEHPVLLLFARYTSARSLDTVRRSLTLAATVLADEPCDAKRFPWWLLRRPHMLRLRGLLADRYAPATCNKVLTVVRQVLLECSRAKVIASEHYTDAIDFERVKGSRMPKGRSIEPEEIDRMEAQCDTATPLGKRNLALVRLLVQTGIRRDESTRLDLVGWDRARGVVRVIGKGNKERDVHCNGPLREALADWIDNTRGDASGPLFHPASPSGVIQRGRRLSYGGMQSAIADLAARAGVTNIALHDFRRTLIGDLLDEGTDLATVAKIVGHEDPKTTAKYDRRGARTAREALERHGARKTKDDQ